MNQDRQDREQQQQVQHERHQQQGGQNIRDQGGLDASQDNSPKKHHEHLQHKHHDVHEDKMALSKVSQVKGKQQLWKAYDFLFPGGKLAKLIKIHNIYKNNLPIREMLEKFKYNERLPVINLIGAMEKGRGKFYAGVVRAAFNTDAVIIDNGLASGIEKFALRRGIKFIGVAPEGQIKFPKINPTQVDPMELANGHTHLFLVNNPTKDLRWGGQVAFKINLCLSIAEGKNKPKGVDRCKIVSIVMGDATFDVMDQIKLCVQNEIPLIVIPGSGICDQITKASQGGNGKGQIAELIKQGHFFYCNSTNSEDIAQLTHLLLSIRPW